MFEHANQGKAFHRYIIVILMMFGNLNVVLLVVLSCLEHKNLNNRQTCTSRK